MGLMSVSQVARAAVSSEEMIIAAERIDSCNRANWRTSMNLLRKSLYDIGLAASPSRAKCRLTRQSAACGSHHNDEDLDVFDSAAISASKGLQ